jgi:hypothetical protein
MTEEAGVFAATAETAVQRWDSDVTTLLHRLLTSFVPTVFQTAETVLRLPARICANEASMLQNAGSDVLQLATGTTLFAVFPTGEGGHIEASSRPSLRSQAPSSTWTVVGP